MLLGALAGVLAGALWGLTFVAPLVADPYTPFDLTVARYLAFGAVSGALLAPGGFAAVRRLPRRDLALLALLGFAGNVGYYLLMALAVPLAGSAVVALVIGCLPVVMAVLGNAGPGRVPARRLAPPLLVLGAGLLVVNGAALAEARAGGTSAAFAGGLGLTAAALALWAWYGLANARALAARPALSAAEWTALTGLGTALALGPVLPIGLAAGLSAVPGLGFAGPDAVRLAAWGVALGALSSWAATWAWSVAARRLPVALAGQLIVSETLFALLYGALHERRGPGWGEAVGAALMVAGVLAALRVFARRRPSAPSAGGTPPEGA